MSATCAASRSPNTARVAPAAAPRPAPPNARTAVFPTFRAVPMDVHLTFRVALMAVNAPFMQALMGLGVVTSLTFAYTARGRARIAAAAALTSLLVTRFDNVPINERMKTWHVGSLPANYEDQLNRWDTFHDIRTAAAVLAFLLLLTAVELARSTSRAEQPNTAPAQQASAAVTH